MEYLDAEGICNPVIDPQPDDQPNCIKKNWDSLIGDAQMALQVTLDELALLAGIVTAETATHTLPYIPASPDQSAYSLLLDPILFKFHC